MKTQQMFATLRAFADVAEVKRAEELRRFANVFGAGKDEAVSARVNGILRHWSPRAGHPAELRKDLAAIAARRQADDVQSILSLFVGPGTATVEGFVGLIAEAIAASSKKASSARRNQERLQEPDLALVARLVEGLREASRNPDAFAAAVERLRDAKVVSTPTLAAIANQFLGKSKRYSGRKAPIDDIVKRQALDARSTARGKALEPIGV